MLFQDATHNRLGQAAHGVTRFIDIEPDLILHSWIILSTSGIILARCRNLWLDGVAESLLGFAARRDVSSLHAIERALGIPMKRFEQPMLGFLSRDEMLAVIGQPGDNWTSQRDHFLLVLRAHKHRSKWSRRSSASE